MPAARISSRDTAASTAHSSPHARMCVRDRPTLVTKHISISSVVVGRYFIIITTRNQRERESERERKRERERERERESQTPTRQVGRTEENPGQLGQVSDFSWDTAWIIPTRQRAQRTGVIQQADRPLVQRPCFSTCTHPPAVCEAPSAGQAARTVSGAGLPTRIRFHVACVTQREILRALSRRPRGSRSIERTYPPARDWERAKAESAGRAARSRSGQGLPAHECMPIPPRNCRQRQREGVYSLLVAHHATETQQPLQPPSTNNIHLSDDYN